MSEALRTMDIYSGQIAAHPVRDGREQLRLARLYHEMPINSEEALAAREELLASNLALVIAIAQRYVQPSYSIEDLVQEGNIALILALEKFDPTHTSGKKFSSYAYQAIEWRIRDVVYNHAKNPNELDVYTPRSSSLDQMLEDDQWTPPSIENQCEVILSQEVTCMIAERADRLCELLSKEAAQVFRDYFFSECNGDYPSQRDIARKHGKTPQAVNLNLKRALETARKSGIFDDVREHID